MKYTIEQFEADFENAYNIEQKRDVLELAIDHLNTNDSMVKETILKYKDELSDLLDNLRNEMHQECLEDIERKELEIYTCINTYKDCIVGNNYYVRIDDICTDLKQKWSNQGSPKEIMEAIEKMRPIIYIYHDNGIGTPMRKSTFKNGKSFLDYFKKFEK